MPWTRKPTLLLPICLAATILLTSCGTKTDSASNLPPPSLSVACVVFEPIPGSTDDTTETLRAIVAHNAAWDAICDDNQ